MANEIKKNEIKAVLNFGYFIKSFFLKTNQND